MGITNVTTHTCDFCGEIKYSKNANNTPSNIDVQGRIWATFIACDKCKMDVYKGINKVKEAIRIKNHVIEENETDEDEQSVYPPSSNDSDFLSFCAGGQSFSGGRTKNIG